MQINLTDRSFEKEKAEHYQLSVQVDSEGLSYCVFDIERKQHVVLKSYKFDQMEPRQDMINSIAGILAGDDLMDLSYASVMFMYYTQQSTLIPSSYFNKRYLKDYLSFNHSLDDADELFCNYIQPLGIWNVFAIPSVIGSLISNQFDHATIAHQATSFLWQVNQNAETIKGYHVRVGLNSDFFDIAVLNHNGLLLYNTFQYGNETDLLYFVLYIYKQMKIDLSNAPLIISGEHAAKMILFDTLKKYIPELIYADKPGTFALTPGLFTIPVYKFLNLLNLHNCVSSEENIKEGE